MVKNSIYDDNAVIVIEKSAPNNSPQPNISTALTVKETSNNSRSIYTSIEQDGFKTVLEYGITGPFEVSGTLNFNNEESIDLSCDVYRYH